MAVTPESRDNGYGAHLIEIAEYKLMSLGATKVEIAIVAQFERLRDYYVGLGYSPGETRKFPGLPFEVQFLVKEINSIR